MRDSVNLVKGKPLCSPEAYPLYSERILQTFKIPVWIAALVLGALVGFAFAVSNVVAGLPVFEHFAVVFPVIGSIAMAPILTVVVRDRSLAAYGDLLPVLDESEHGKFLSLLRKVFDQRRSLEFATIIGAAGVLHHIVLSYVNWGRIWWYSVVDIVLVGFVWWFVVASFFWTCASVAWYSYHTSKCLRFNPRFFSYRRMCGLESFGSLSVVPSVAWGIVATFGILSTFDPAVVRQFPLLIIVYLSLDFVIVASSMTTVFFFPVLGYRAIVLPLKRAWSKRIDQLMSQVKEIEIDGTATIDEESALIILYLWAISHQIRQIKGWPLSQGAGVRFILSYVIPSSVYVGRLILFASRVPVPL